MFLLLKGELGERFDSTYYQPSESLNIVNNSKYPKRKLSEVAELLRGRFSHRPRNDPKFYGGNYPFIQTGDVVRASNQGGEIQYTQTLNELGLGVSKQFDANILVITIAANIGDTAILTYPACFPDSLVTVKPKNDNLDIRYLNIFFKYLKPYLNEIAPQAAQKNINIQQLSPVPIILPPIETQQTIINIFENAYAEKKAKEAQAKELLASIDGYFLEELGISLPKKQENILKNRVFLRNISEVSGGRFDAEFYKLEFERILKSIDEGLYSSTFAKDVIVSVINGFDFRDYKESGVPYIKVANVKKGEFDFSKIQYIEFGNENITKSIQLEKGNLLLTRKGTFGNALSLDNNYDYVISSEVFYLKLNKKVIQSGYLEAFFNSSIGQKQFSMVSVGAIMGSLSQESLKYLKISLPSLEIQEKIVAETTTRRKQAKRLQAEAKEILEKAKAEVERMILG